MRNGRGGPFYLDGDGNGLIIQHHQPSETIDVEERVD